MIKTTLTSAALGLMLAATPAAADTSETPGVKIEYRDLDLDTPEGQEKLERRIDAAASQICKLNERRTGTRLPSRASKQCFAEARATAKSQMATLIANQQRGG
ncbi:UrcA family protein [Altererythrobacter sp.]|uniref:UrcA family protein n=1 Tax=Altererythrobacter sp. TaxID=1872480 RepID=UPI003D05FA1D